VHQVETLETRVESAWLQRLRLKYEAIKLLSSFFSFAFNSIFRPSSEVFSNVVIGLLVISFVVPMVGWCKLKRVESRVESA